MAQKPYTIVNDFPEEDCKFGIPPKYLPGIMSVGNEPMRLMMYYVSCKTGFAPAVKAVEKATMLAQPNIVRARNALEKEGIIKLDKDKHTLTVLWDKILLRAVAVASFDLYREDHPDDHVTDKQMQKDGKFFVESYMNETPDELFGRDIAHRRKRHEKKYEMLPDKRLQKTLEHVYTTPVHQVIKESRMLGIDVPDGYYEKAIEIRKRCENAERRDPLQREMNKWMEVPLNENEDNSELPF